MNGDTILGFDIKKLTKFDLRQELISLKSDLSTIEDYEQGIIPHSEMVAETIYKITDKSLIKEAIEVYREHIRGNR